MKKITITIPTPIAIHTNTDTTEDITTKTDITGIDIIKINATTTGVATGDPMTAIVIIDHTTEIVITEDGTDSATDSCTAGINNNYR